jgi:RNA polymerase sigma-70 factor, ECF subfamily
MDPWSHPSELHMPEDFEVFYREMYAPVVAIVYGLTRNGWVAEEIAQEAFLRAYRDWFRVVRMESPSGWVRRVALNLACSRFRRVRAEVVGMARLGSSRDQPTPHEPEVATAGRRMARYGG